MTENPALGFGDIAARYAALRPAYPPSLFDFLESHLKGPRDFAVDLGAGPCKASVDLAARFARVAAVEPDPRMLAHAPAHDRIEKINCAAEDADFARQSVDAAISATAFHWMNQSLVCARVARWLRPGGVFFPFLYGPFFLKGAAASVFARHWALWTPHMGKSLGVKADYSAPMRASKAFSRIETYSGDLDVAFTSADAAGLLLTASYVRAFMAAKGLGEAYIDRLAEELAPHAPVTIGFPLGGVLGVRG